jgi:hypothetical protein
MYRRMLRTLKDVKRAASLTSTAIGSMVGPPLFQPLLDRIERNSPASIELVRFDLASPDQRID